METPKQRAFDIYNGIMIALPLTGMKVSELAALAKRLARISVQEIIESNSDFGYSTNIWDSGKRGLGFDDCMKYWDEVKKEIENLEI